MSPTQKTIRQWSQPDDNSHSHVRSSSRTASTGNLRVVRAVDDEQSSARPVSAAHNHDTIVSATPYALDAEVATIKRHAPMVGATGTIVQRAPVAPNGTVVMKAPLVAPPAATSEPAKEEIAPTPAEHLTPQTKPVIDSMKLNKFIVSSYKIMGFAVLGTILLGLASFIATNLFYMFNESWVTPMQLSSTDPRVLQLAAQYSAAKAARDGVSVQQRDLASRLSDARRIQASEAKFQEFFDQTMQANLQDRLGQLAQFQQLMRNIGRTRGEVSAVNKQYTNISKAELSQEYKAGLIDKNEQVRGGFELAQIQGANLGLHEKNVEIDARVTDLQREVEALRNRGGGAANYEILKMRHEYELSVLAGQKAADDADALAKSVAAFDGTLAEYDAQIARIQKAPYVEAADKSVNTAFVPYDNIGAVKAGDNVYSCAVSFLFCHKIGTIAEVLDGEIIGKHPLHNRDMRGILVRLQLDDKSAIEKPVLHLHRKPMGV
jgi:hypothetical protein